MNNQTFLHSFPVNMAIYMKNLFLLTLIILSTVQLGLASEDALTRGEEALILEKNRHLFLSIDNHDLKIIEKNETSTKFLDNVNQVNRDAVVYSSFDPMISFEAYTKVPTKNGKYKKVPVSVMETKEMVSPGIFYGGYERKDFVFSAVVPEAIGVVKYTLLNKDPHMLGSFYFDDYFKTEKASYSITFPSSVAIKYNLFNIKEDNITFDKAVVDNMTTYTWTMENIEGREYEANAPTAPYYAPHIIVRIESYEGDQEIIKVSSTSDDLFNWYNSLIKQIPDEEPETEIIQKVKELTTGISNREQKVKALYNWVQENIKYVAFEDGMAGFVPRSAPSIYEKKYGDCKDMANLLTTMLNYAEIPAYLTWVGTNKKPYSYNEVPCTLVDNHMICSIKDGDQFRFLDPTNRFLQYEYPPSHIQGKETLIRIDDKSYEIIKAPVTEAKRNTRTDNLELEIEGTALNGKVKSSLNGYFSEEYLYERMDDNEKIDILIKNFLNLGKKSSNYIDPKFEERPGEIDILFDAQFRNDVINIGEKAYINLNLDPSIEDFKIENISTRELPVQQEFKHQYQINCTVTIPEGYKVDFLPEPASVDNGNCSITTNYKQEGNKVILNKVIVSNYLMLQQKDFEAYKAFYKELVKINQQKITIKKL